MYREGRLGSGSLGNMCEDLRAVGLHPAWVAASHPCLVLCTVLPCIPSMTGAFLFSRQTTYPIVLSKSLVWCEKAISCCEACWQDQRHNL